MPLPLIEKLDTFEIVRNKIVAILKTEIAAQVAQATAKNLDPDLWDATVYTNHVNPLEDWLDQGAGDNLIPVLNVSFLSATFPRNQGNVVASQQVEGRFLIDCIAAGASKRVVNIGKPDGHINGGEDAAINASRAVKIARNILMSSEYTYLDLPRSLVSQRWVDSIESYPINETSIKSYHAKRLVLAVKYLEFSPQYQGELLELLHVDIDRLEDKKNLAHLEFDFAQGGIK